MHAKSLDTALTKTFRTYKRKEHATSLVLVTNKPQIMHVLINFCLFVVNAFRFAPH